MPVFDTAVTRLLGIRHPILLAQMTRVSTPALVAAVSEAGGLGVLATATLGADATRQAIHEIRRRTDGPFGVGVPLLLPTGRENTEAALAERVPVIIFSLGNGALAGSARPRVRWPDHRHGYHGERGVQPIGQVQGLVRDAPSVADILRRMMEEAGRAAAGIEQSMAIGASRRTPLRRSDS